MSGLLPEDRELVRQAIKDIEAYHKAVKSLAAVLKSVRSELASEMKEIDRDWCVAEITRVLGLIEVRKVLK